MSRESRKDRVDPFARLPFFYSKRTGKQINKQRQDSNIYQVWILTKLYLST